MWQRGSVFLGGVALFAATPALAVTTIDKSQAVAGARSDPGTGICGTATHFSSGQSVLGKADAEAIMNKPANDAVVLGRTARVFDIINLRNGQLNTGGDFTKPSFPDQVLPFSIDPMATPMGTDSNITLRLRGYFNVPATLVGKTVSFGLNCDDFCALRVGTTDLAPVGNELISARVITQVTFTDAGLYPVEMVYYQNGSTAYLEWAKAATAVDQCDDCPYELSDAAKYMGAFSLIAATDLYSAKLGANPSCQECGLPGMDCSMGNYCGDGLCQVCNLPDHCGPNCITCPVGASLCNGSKCVQCTADDQCPTGQICDIPSGTCVPPQPCAVTAQCPPQQICIPTTNLCANPPVACTTDAMCPPGQTCTTATGDCHTKPVLCSADKECQHGFTCDPDQHLCSLVLPRQIVTGCTAAWTRDRSSAWGRSGLAFLLLGFAVAPLTLFRWRRGRSGKPSAPP